MHWSYLIYSHKPILYILYCTSLTISQDAHVIFIYFQWWLTAFSIFGLHTGPIYQPKNTLLWETRSQTIYRRSVNAAEKARMRGMWKMGQILCAHCGKGIEGETRVWLVLSRGSLCSLSRLSSLTESLLQTRQVFAPLVFRDVASVAVAAHIWWWGTSGQWYLLSIRGLLISSAKNASCGRVYVGSAI